MPSKRVNELLKIRTRLFLVDAQGVVLILRRTMVGAEEQIEIGSKVSEVVACALDPCVMPMMQFRRAKDVFERAKRQPDVAVNQRCPQPSEDGQRAKRSKVDAHHDGRQSNPQLGHQAIVARRAC